MSLPYSVHRRHSSHTSLSAAEVYICGPCSLDTGLRTASECLPSLICTRVVVPRLSFLEHERRKCHILCRVSLCLLCAYQSRVNPLSFMLRVLDRSCIVPLPRAAFCLCPLRLEPSEGLFCCSREAKSKSRQRVEVLGRTDGGIQTFDFFTS